MRLLGLEIKVEGLMTGALGRPLRFVLTGRLFVVEAGVGYNWFDPAGDDLAKVAALTVHDDAVMGIVEIGQR